MSGERFQFLPDLLSIAIGDFAAEFRVGVDPYVIPQIYWFQIQVLSVTGPIIMTELLHVKQTLLVQVLAQQIVIDLPDTMELPLGGCTVPYTIVIVNPPLYPFTIENTFDVAGVEFDIEVSSNKLEFSSSKLVN
jgi:hypothetical protein